MRRGHLLFHEFGNLYDHAGPVGGMQHAVPVGNGVRVHRYVQGIPLTCQLVKGGYLRVGKLVW